MIDLTTEKEDKDSYITKVELVDDNKYEVVYASGRTEEFEFSIHNFMVELYRMEEQYEKYGKEYLDNIYPNKYLMNFLIFILLANNTAYFIHVLNNGLSVGNGIPFVYCMIIGLRTTLKHIKSTKAYLEAKKKIAILKLYMENKEQFKVQVQTDSGKLEDWYFVNLSNIDDFSSIDSLKAYIADLEETPVVSVSDALKLVPKKGQ